jgi:hypothetical protein
MRVFAVRSQNVDGKNVDKVMVRDLKEGEEMPDGWSKDKPNVVNGELQVKQAPKKKAAAKKGAAKGKGK